MVGGTMPSIAFGVLMGVVATATMDVLAKYSRKAGLTVGAKGRWVGRWCLGMVPGKFVHEDIRTAPEEAGEARAALIGHYAIGIVLAVVYVLGCSGLGLAPSSLAVALGYGLATCVFPCFLMFPAFGFGVFGRKGPPGSRLLWTSVLNHLYYGLGLWWVAVLLGLG